MTNSKLNQDLVNRLNRISGQVAGISKMIDENKDCILVMEQLMASRSALAKVASRLLTSQSCDLQNQNNPEKMEKIVNKLINLQ